MGINKLFESTKVGGIVVKNRIFRSATYEGTAENGKISKQILDTYSKLADGGVGLIITGYMCVSKTDNPGSKTVMITNDSFIQDLRKLTDTVHNKGVKIVAQLNHTTSQIYFQPQGYVYGPSNIVDPITGITTIPLSIKQISELIIEFGDAAIRAKTAGFDGVQIHCAHGYLLNRFLSPVFNKRSDKYGGTLQNNLNIVLEILEEIKRRCGEDFPVWVKLNCSDFYNTKEEVDNETFLFNSRELSLKGIDAIEVSGGTPFGQYQSSRSKEHEAYHLDCAIKLQNSVNASVILVGGLRKIDIIEHIISDMEIDAVSLCRSLIREPDLINRWERGDKKVADCVACNGCFNPQGAKCFFLLSKEEKAAQLSVIKLRKNLLDRNK
jgi:2,4-dienoyl-CoA reductase-like NADH-dependent reductase (Old Yellow Enzyme family)